MVNAKENDTRSEILRLLRSADGPVNGQELGEVLGVSRVAVHKHIRGLRDIGYELESDHRGYRLRPAGDLPFSTWEFSSAENITVIDETVSTMDEAHRRVELHPGEDFVLAALKQSGGRGRRNRSWASPEGGLWVTRVIHPGGSMIHAPLRVMAGAWALARLLNDSYGIAAALKWPNDVLVGGDKIAGVLGEARFSGDRLRYLAIGMGVNVNNPSMPGTAALHDILGRDGDRRELLRGWISVYDGLVTSGSFRPGKKPVWWNGMMAGIGETVEHRISGRRIRGRILGTDALGRLVLETDNGKKKRIAAGDIDGDGK